MRFHWVVYIGIVLWLEWPVVLHPFTRIVGDIPDAYQYTWYLGWFWHALINGLNPFYSHEINFPQGLGFMYNTSAIAESFLFGWLVPLTTAVFVYNLVFFLNVIFIGVFARLLLRELGVSEWLSVWGAAMLCLMPYLTAQELGHLSQYFVSPLFLFAYLLARFMKRGARKHSRYGALLGIVFAFEFYTSLEFTVTALLSVCIFLVYLLVQRSGRQKLKQGLSQLRTSFWVSFILVTILLILPGIIEFVVTGGLILAHKTVHEATGEIWVADLLSPLIPTHLQLMHQQVTDNAVSYFNGHPEEKGNYLGVFLIALVLSLRNRWRGPISRALGWLIFTMLVLSMGDRLHIGGHPTNLLLPWFLFSHLPFLNSALPMRLAVFVDMGVIVWTCVSLQRWMESKTNLHLPTWSYIMLLVCFLSWLPSTPYPNSGVFTLPKSIVKQVGKQPVYFIGANFAYDMQPLTASSYGIDTYNNYGFSPYQGMDHTPDPAVSFYTHHLGLSIDAWSADLYRLETEMHSGYIVLTPFDTTNTPIPPNFRIAIERTLGTPLLQVNGCELWAVGNVNN